MMPARLRSVLRTASLLVLLNGAVFVALAVCGVGLICWTLWFPPKPVYSLIVYNQGALEIVGGYLSGDSLWRPVGQVLPGRATDFVFVGCGGRDDADYRLHLVRSDSSRVTVQVGWISGDWTISTLSHDISVIPNDSAAVCSLIVPMYKQNEFRRLLRSARLIDYPQR